MVTNGTVQPTQSGRRVVRCKRPTLDEATGAALGDLPVDLRQPLINYADAKRAEYDARSALSALLTKNRMRWREIDDVVRELTYGGH